MYKYILTVAMTWAGWTGCALGAAVPADAPSAESLFAARVHVRFPGTQTAVIGPAFPDFHYVVKGGEVLFVRDDLTVLISGNVIDLATNKSMVADIKARNPRRVDVSTLDPNDAIHLGHGRTRLYVFSDPDCPYCRSLQAELAKLRDVEVLVYPFPLTQLHPGARDIATSIWCQQDRAAAWDGYVLRREAVASRTCDTPIDRNLALGERLGIRATPTFVLPNGAVVEGMNQADRIQALMLEATK